MAYLFGDGFDSYATIADAALGYWDGFVNGAIAGLTTGRFAGSQALRFGSSGGVGSLMKISGVNDAVHHIVVAFMQNVGIAGSTISSYIQLSDGATGQCAIGFRSDGTILLASGNSLGTILATYSGAVTAANTWFAFEFEIVINNTTGSFKVRKNGNTVDDHATININTRGGTANNYANRLTVGGNASAVNYHNFDDILWRSDASSVPFVGDVRCYTRAPASDVTTTFARTPTSATVNGPVAATVGSFFANTARYTPITPPYDGTIGSLTVAVQTGYTGNLKCSIFASPGGVPTTVLGSATPINNPVVGSNTFTFPTPVSVVKNVQYWVGICTDATSSFNASTAGNGGLGSNTTYAAFPVASPSTSAAQNLGISGPLAITANYGHVSETLQDGTTSYVYSSNPTDADFYTVGPLAQTPASVIAVVTRGFIQKSDAGTRLGAVQLKSGGTTVATPNAVMGTTFGWVYRTDANDPATGLPWTHTAVSAVNIGPLVVS